MKTFVLVLKFYLFVIILSFIVGSIRIFAKTPPGLWGVLIGLFVLFGLIYNLVKDQKAEFPSSQIVTIGICVSIPYLLIFFIAPRYFGGIGFSLIEQFGISAAIVIFLIAVVHTLVNLSKRILADKPIDDEYEN